ncbi:AAA family ATPase [Blastococcus sp. TF02-9]|uniref:AAA family ATPase n=1 Tax=Blastococcus sp. TF02-09 TaxID=2250576 RepID=UPI0013140F8A|nr:AAA family ATPase [Blastococcus sp. TF02-9]
MAYLGEDNWDDFGLKTLFEAQLILGSGETVVLGGVKIFRRGQEAGRTDVPTSFTQLSKDYYSLGQDPLYYEMLRVRPDLRADYLRAIRDVTLLSPREIAELERESAWRKSLLRYGQAEAALDAELRTAQHRQRAPGVLSFDFRLTGRADAPTAAFRFDDTRELPGRVNVVIGYNGVGKTKLLADLASAASRVRDAELLSEPAGGELGQLTGEDTFFGAVIAVSYSAFDSFVRPPSRPSVEQPGETNFFGYTYCGLRRLSSSTSAEVTGRGLAAGDNSAEGDASAANEAEGQRVAAETLELKGIDELTAEFQHAFGQARDHPGQRPHLLEALRHLSAEPSFGRIGINPAELVTLPADRVHSEFADSSTGHKFVLNIVAQLAANLRQRSLVLLDEPEAHLHPPLVAALLKAVHHLLQAHDSFAVVATHSPVVLQEIPADHVHVLSRFGQETRLSAVDIETFAEGIGAITRSVFHLDSSATDFQGTLRELASRHAVTEIEGMFRLGLSAQGRAMVVRYRRSAAPRD